jgi:hypothetical protein
VCTVVNILPEHLMMTGIAYAKILELFGQSELK